jgi:hypothetical protein
MRGGERFEHRWPPLTAKLSSEERDGECLCLSECDWLTGVYRRKVVGGGAKEEESVRLQTKEVVVWEDENGLCILCLMTKMAFVFLTWQKTFAFFANIDVAKYCDWLLSPVGCVDFLVFGQARCTFSTFFDRVLLRIFFSTCCNL